jgi:hypothetical protein
MLAKDPAARPASCDELMRALEVIPIEDELESGFQKTESSFQNPEPGFQSGQSNSAEPDGAAPPVRDRYRLEAELSATAVSRLHRAVDERLGRTVLVEELAADALDGEAGAARLSWLRAMARHGSPHLQRVLRIEPPEPARPATRVVYEELPGSPLWEPSRAPDRAALARALRDLLAALAGPHAEGVGHGRLDAALWVDGRAVLPVAGLAPLQLPAEPRREIAELSARVRALGGAAVADLPAGDDAGALRAWTRAARR